MPHFISSEPSATELAAMEALAAGDSGGSCQEPPSSGVNCPKASDALTSIQKKAHWYYYNQDGFPQMDWPVVGGAWQVKIQEADPPPPPPAATNRHKYDIMTYCCFTDFYLELKFRCPNQRTIWDKCNANKGLEGPRNWGNSGVIVQNTYELQILDSHGVVIPDPKPATTAKTDLGGCKAAGTFPARFGEICGALYMNFVPDANGVKTAENVDGKSPPEPGGMWNEMRIWFMTARYDVSGATPVLKKKATFTVKINQLNAYNAVPYTHQRQGITKKTSGSRAAPGKFGRIADNRYGSGWKMDRGPLVLQEHDNKVEFKDIKIDLSWKPKKADDSFDDAWQQDA